MSGPSALRWTRRQSVRSAAVSGYGASQPVQHSSGAVVVHIKATVGRRVVVVPHRQAHSNEGFPRGQQVVERPNGCWWSLARHSAASHNSPRIRFVTVTSCANGRGRRLARHVRVIPVRYHGAMAMTLRLTPEDEQLLAALAEAEGVSRHEATLRAIRDAAVRHAHVAEVAELSARARERYARVLERLGR